MNTFLFFFQAEDGIRDLTVTGVQTCALPISRIRRGLSVGAPGHRGHRVHRRRGAASGQGSDGGRRPALHRVHSQARGGVTRGLASAAALLLVAAGAAAQVDSMARRDTVPRDSTTRRDTTARDTTARDTDRKSTRLNSSHSQISYAVFCLKKKKNNTTSTRWYDRHSTTIHQVAPA